MNFRKPAGAAGGLPEAPVLLAFVFSVFLAGANAVAVRFTVEELAPFWGAAIRFAAAALIFGLMVLFRRAPLPHGRALLGVIIYGILNFGLSFALIYSAIRDVTAGLTMVILALTPLLTFLFAVLHRLEPFRWRAMLGALLAVVGIAVAFMGQGAGGAPLWAVLFVVAAAACFAEATVVLKMLPPVSPLSANAVGMAAATVLLVLLSLVFAEAWVLPQQFHTWTAVLYLVLFGSVALFYLLVYIIQHWTATASSYIVVLAPFVTVPLAALLAGEEMTAGLVLGAVLVLAAVFVGVLSGGTAAEAPAAKAQESTKRV
jgi:drug/metabolite transporter (DMT)-like permease